MFPPLGTEPGPPVRGFWPCQSSDPLPFTEQLKLQAPPGDSVAGRAKVEM